MVPAMDKTDAPHSVQTDLIAASRHAAKEQEIEAHDADKLQSVGETTADTLLGVLILVVKWMRKAYPHQNIHMQPNFPEELCAQVSGTTAPIEELALALTTVAARTSATAEIALSVKRIASNDPILDAQPRIEPVNAQPGYLLLQCGVTANIAEESAATLVARAEGELAQDALLRHECCGVLAGVSDGDAAASCTVWLALPTSAHPPVKGSAHDPSPVETTQVSRTWSSEPDNDTPERAFRRAMDNDRDIHHALRLKLREILPRPGNLGSSIKADSPLRRSPMFDPEEADRFNTAAPFPVYPRRLSRRSLLVAMNNLPSVTADSEPSTPGIQWRPSLSKSDSTKLIDAPSLSFSPSTAAPAAALAPDAATEHKVAAPLTCSTSDGYSDAPLSARSAGWESNLSNSNTNTTTAVPTPASTRRALVRMRALSFQAASSDTPRASLSGMAIDTAHNAGTESDPTSSGVTPRWDAP